MWFIFFNLSFSFWSLLNSSTENVGSTAFNDFSEFDLLVQFLIRLSLIPSSWAALVPDPSSFDKLTACCLNSSVKVLLVRLICSPGSALIHSQKNVSTKWGRDQYASDKEYSIGATKSDSAADTLIFRIVLKLVRSMGLSSMLMWPLYYLFGSMKSSDQ